MLTESLSAIRYTFEHASAETVLPALELFRDNVTDKFVSAVGIRAKANNAWKASFASDPGAPPCASILLLDKQADTAELDFQSHVGVAYAAKNRFPDSEVAQKVWKAAHDQYLRCFQPSA